MYNQNVTKEMEKTILVNGPRESQDELTMDRHWG